MKVIVSLLALLFVSNVQAGIFLEPYIGYYKGEADLQTSAGTVTSDESGIGYGGRLGFTVAGTIFIAGDITLVKGKSKFSGEPEDDLEAMDYAAVAGVTTGMFRFWGGYIFKSDVEITVEDVSTDYEADGWKAGIGVLMYKKVSLNLEYIKKEYSSIDGMDIPNPAITSLESEGYFVSLSFPIGF